MFCEYMNMQVVYFVKERWKYVSPLYIFFIPSLQKKVWVYYFTLDRLFICGNKILSSFFSYYSFQMFEIQPNSFFSMPYGRIYFCKNLMSNIRARILLCSVPIYFCSIFRKVLFINTSGFLRYSLNRKKFKISPLKHTPLQLCRFQYTDKYKNSTGTLHCNRHEAPLIITLKNCARYMSKYV